MLDVNIILSPCQNLRLSKQSLAALYTSGQFAMPYNNVIDSSELGHTSLFHIGHLESLLFPDLFVDTKREMFGACVVVFLVAMLYEGLRLFVAWFQLYVNAQLKTAGCCRVWLLGTAQTAVYMFHMLAGYCLMLVFMIMNVWLCLAVLLGAGAGFVLFHFRPVKSRLFRLLSKGDNNAVGEADDTAMVSYAKGSEGSGEGGGCHGMGGGDGLANLGYDQLEDYRLGGTKKGGGR